MWKLLTNKLKGMPLVNKRNMTGYTFKVFFHRPPCINSRQTQLGFFTAYPLSIHRHITMQVFAYILLAIMLFSGAFGPGARTCYAVRYVNKMEHSRTGLRVFEKRDIPAYAVRYVNKMEHSRTGLRVFEKRDIPAGGGYPAPARNKVRGYMPRPPPPGTIY
jgi:hypothetical protein